MAASHDEILKEQQKEVEKAFLKKYLKSNEELNQFSGRSFGIGTN